jgi:hypothetical protein
MSNRSVADVDLNAKMPAVVFPGPDIATELANLPCEELPTPRLFEIVPTIASVRHNDGLVQHDDGVMYLISEEAEAALDVILEPYREFGGFYLDKMLVKFPGPWGYIGLRREYDIANYVVTQRAKLDGRHTFSFTFFDSSVDFNAAGFIPKVGCFIFFSKTAAEAAAKTINFLQPVSDLLQKLPAEKHWLILLDENPQLVLSEAAN